jgi:threonine dehydrogenase-like Zn-dependent dehydrogenase
MALDESIAALGGQFKYPFKYGYAAVGEVVEAGEQAEQGWLGRRVFSFHPHESRFSARPEELMPVPDDIPDEAAAMLPNMETAVNFVMDGRPVIGEKVAVFGLGLVGLMTTALLARFPLGELVGFDPIESRREQAAAAGASLTANPKQGIEQIGQAWADLVYELSGNPVALDAAIEAAGFEGRVVIGSWYGQKQVTVNLGGRFHRSRVKLISSQVSTLEAGFSGRWDKPRRLEVAWESLRTVRPERWITHRFAFEDAQRAYRLLAQGGGAALGIALVY